MRSYFLPLFILLLFFTASVFLTIRQETLLRAADQDIVSIGYLEPHAKSDSRFFIDHQADASRVLSLQYHYPDQETETTILTLLPKERKILTPPTPPLSITVRYQDQDSQEQILTLYKK